MHQYFYIISKKVKVLISDKLCRVDSKGNIEVVSWREVGSSNDLTDNYVKGMSELF